MIEFTVPAIPVAQPRARATAMKHTSETKSKISKSSKELAARRTPERESLRMLKALKTRESNGTLYPPKHGNWKSDWRDIGGKRKYFRSRWEANYARYLEFLKQNGKIKDWEHEPKTFWFEKILRGVRSYLPDFLVTELDGSERYFEVKGWMDPKSITKIKRMAKYYPDVVLVVVDSKAYKALAKQVGGFIQDWE